MWLKVQPDLLIHHARFFIPPEMVSIFRADCNLSFPALHLNGHPA